MVEGTQECGLPLASEVLFSLLIGRLVWIAEARPLGKRTQRWSGESSPLRNTHEHLIVVYGLRAKTMHLRPNDAIRTLLHARFLGPALKVLDLGLAGAGLMIVRVQQPRVTSSISRYI
jgi:hypothetical protein